MARRAFIDSSVWIGHLSARDRLHHQAEGAIRDALERRIALLTTNRSVKGWYSGTSIDSQDTLAFSQRAGVRSMNETYPFEKVSEAYDRMMSGKARFRVVLTIGK